MDSVNIRPNVTLIHKLVDQIINHMLVMEGKPERLRLTHDEIDAWRSQFDTIIPVSELSFRGIPIVEAVI